MHRNHLFMRIFLIVILSLTAGVLHAQELYVYSDPASNIPAHSVSTKLSAGYMPPQPWNNRGMQRYTPEVMLGLSKKFMLRTGATFADVHTSGFGWESVYLYGKYRFLSHDELHSHFRIAAYVEGAYSRAPFHNEEINLTGDKSGIQAGVIATQLWHKFALSGTVSHTQVLHSSRNNKVTYIPSRIYQAMNYSVSAGYLLLPREYKDYRQTNLNLYTEILAQQSLDRNRYYVDVAPAVQLIFNSTTKLNLGYRFQVGGNMQRMSENSWMIGIDHTFLNALKPRK
jgi:hypothetical protein